jgi:glycosyltransferase involved in cell wall biosynthesis
VPTLNAAATLRLTLESLRPLVEKGCRVLVVDGGSTDATRAIAEAFPCTLLTCAGSMYHAINAGFAHADADAAWLTWINADDLLYADTALSRIADADGRDDVLYGPVDFIDSAGRFLHCWQSAAPRDLLVLYRAGYSPLLQQGTLFRREAHEKVVAFDTHYSLVADADYWWRALEIGLRFRHAPRRSVAAFRLHAEQQSFRHRERMQGEHAAMVAAHGASISRGRAVAPLCRWRYANATNYAVRCLRQATIRGRSSFVRSYDIPPATETSP